MRCLQNITVDLWQPSFALQSLGFIVLDLVIVFGNLLVIVAILKFRNLRTVNGLFLVSLAVADLSLGVFVLPFSSVNELLQSWLFGSFWCHSWLIIDVLLCTSSIYNLVGISIDRYIAITRPLSYPTMVTRSRGRGAIVFVWLLAFFISLPPMVYPAGAEDPLPVFLMNHTPVDTSCSCTPMNNTPMYIIYSAMGSFFIPMIVISIIYFRIFLIVRRVKQSMHSGVLFDKSQPKNGEADSGGLRVHYGNPKSHGAAGSEYKHAATYTTRRSGSSTVDSQMVEFIRPRRQVGPEDRRLATSDRCLNRSGSARRRGSQTSPDCMSLLSETPGSDHVKDRPTGDLKRPEKSLIAPVKLLSRSVVASAVMLPRRGSAQVRERLSAYDGGSFTGSLTSETGTVRPRISVAMRSLFKHMGRRKRHRTTYRGRFLLELKAAKTVAIVTLCFIFCWIGFALSYVMEAFQQCSGHKCIPGAIANIVFWLGYLNSALNPIIYALFNKHFRIAFKRLLVPKCLCGTKLNVMR